MATTYAAYYNLVQADKAARASESRRASSITNSSAAVSNKERKSSQSTLKKVLNQLRATDEEITPSGIYTPIIKQGPLFQSLKPTEKAQEPTPIYAGLSQRERPLFSLNKKRGSTSSTSSAGSVEPKA